MGHRPLTFRRHNLNIAIRKIGHLAGNIHERDHTASRRIQGPGAAVHHQTRAKLCHIGHIHMVAALLAFTKKGDRFARLRQPPEAIGAIAVMGITRAINQRGAQTGDRKIRERRAQHGLACRMHHAMHVVRRGD